MRRRLILFLVFGVTVSGCVTVRQAPLRESESSRFAGRTLQRSVYPKPDFAAYTAGKAGFGLIGAALIIQAGDEIIRENAVGDPAIHIGLELARALSERHGLQPPAYDPPMFRGDGIDPDSK